MGAASLSCGILRIGASFEGGYGGVSHQCRILAIEVLVTIVEGVAFNMSIVEGLLDYFVRYV